MRFYNDEESRPEQMDAELTDASFATTYARKVIMEKRGRMSTPMSEYEQAHLPVKR